MGEDRYRITLVHGTRLPGLPSSDWAEPDSDLRAAFKDGLGAVEFDRFAWDGKNDEASRTAAATNLAKQISNSMAADPQARHAIVAHSHGGNIVLRAAADPRIADRLSSLVCVGTPFFVSKGRDLVTAVSALARVLAWFFGITALMFVLALQSRDFARMPKLGMPRTAAEFRWWVMAAAAGLIIALVLQLRRRHISAWVARRQASRIGELALPSLGRARVLCIWDKGDKVMLLFRALDRLANLSLFLLRPIPAAVALVLCFLWLAPAHGDAIQVVLKTFRYTLFSMVLTLFLPFALLAEYAAKVIGFNITLLLPLAAAMMAAVTIAVLTAVIWIAAAILHVGLKLVPFGMKDWRLVDTFFLRIAPSPTPPDSSNVASEEMALPRSGLNHSSVFKSGEALRKTVAFVRDNSAPARQQA